MTLYSATRIYPEVKQAIASGLFPAEPKLLIPNLALARTLYQIFKGDLFAIGSPSM
jgi:hypothetical protein